jgi:hypothetical protein
VLSFGPGSGDFVKQCHAGGSARRESRVEVVDGEAEVVNAGTALFNEARDRRVRTLGLEQFDEHIAGLEACDPRAVAVAEGDDGESEDVAKERQGVAEGTHCESQMGNAGTAKVGRGQVSHWRRNGV